MSIGDELGMSKRLGRDTSARLRDSFEAIDYFEMNTENLKINTYNIFIEKNTITGSDTFIIGHTTLGILGSGILGIGSSWTGLVRVAETRVYQDFTDDFTSTGSFNTTISNADYSNSGSVVFSSGSSIAQSLNLSSDIQIAKLNRIRLDVVGSGIRNMELYGSADNGTNFIRLANGAWGETSHTGSSIVWKIESTVGSVTEVKTSWKSTDYR